MLFPSVEVVESIHAELIERYGGCDGLRDRGLLESAVARVENKVFSDRSATVAEVAASLAWGLMKNHAFLDGNKRVGFGALVAFVQANGHRLICPEIEETGMVFRAAAGEILEEEWSAWVSRSIEPL